LGLIDYNPLSENHGNLCALCNACGRTCTRIISKRGQPEWSKTFDLGKSNVPSA